MEQYYPKSPQKTNYWIYTLTIILSFIILYGITQSLIISLTFIDTGSFGPYYFWLSFISLILGGLIGWLLRKISKTDKPYIIGISIISFLTATIISVSLKVQSALSKSLAALDTGTIGELFRNTPNPFLSGFIIIIFTLLIPTLIYYRNQGNNKYLLIYLWSFIIYLVIFWLLPMILLQTTV